MSSMKISEQGISLIKSFESCKLTAYKALSTEEHYTIGWGHYGADVKAGQTISQDEADALFSSDLQQFVKYTDTYTKSLSLNQNQFDALVSFCYNCGPGTLKKLVSGRTVEEIAEHITDEPYTRSKGKVIKGLVRRRQEEKELFCRESEGKAMKIVVGSARVDENGKLSGGKAGDQTGKEVSTQPYYMHSKGWYCYRAKDAKVAAHLASAMKDACDNNNIGYDQGERSTVILQLRRYGTLKGIETKTEADCSSLIRACCIEAGFDTGEFNTASEGAALANTGMFEERKSVTSSTELFDGDILVTKTKGHTVIVVSGNPRKESSAGGVTQSRETASASSKFKVGKNYTLQSDMYIRDSANGKKKQFTKLTVNAKNHGYADQNGFGILKKGTVVTCKDIQEKDGGVWIKIPSGWICGVGKSGEVYAK